MKQLRILSNLVHRYHFGIMFLSVLPFHVIAQRPVNYVLTEKRISTNKTNILEYHIFDGLGRPTIKATNNVGNDNMFVYSCDEIVGEDQVERCWLPIVGDTEALDIDVNWLEKSAAQYGDDFAYESLEYNGLGKIKRHIRPGREWQNKSTNITYVTNGRKDVKRYVTL